MTSYTTIVNLKEPYQCILEKKYSDVTGKTLERYAMHVPTLIYHSSLLVKLTCNFNKNELFCY